jgi:hypothetical protein
MEVKDWITLVFAGLALIVSVISAYYANFNLTDDIRVAFTLSPYVILDDKGGLGISGEQQVTFIDSGNRDVAVIGMTLVLYKLREAPSSNSQCDEMSNIQVASLVYDFEPFILKPGEILVKTFGKTLFPEIWKDDEADKHLKDFALGGSIFGKGDTVFTCLRLSVTTPGMITDHAQIPKHYIKINDVPHKGADAPSVSLVSGSNKPYLVIHRTSTPFSE